MADDELRLRLCVHGLVQGVWYRAWAVEQAMALGLDGWVRNRRDGTVELALRGPPQAVREMVARCRRGPPRARVERVDELPAAESVQAGFRALPTV